MAAKQICALRSLQVNDLRQSVNRAEGNCGTMVKSMTWVKICHNNSSTGGMQKQAQKI